MNQDEVSYLNSQAGGNTRFIDSKASNNDSFCYIVASDKNILFKGYNSIYNKMGVQVSQFSPSLEKSLLGMATCMPLPLARVGKSKSL